MGLGIINSGMSAKTAKDINKANLYYGKQTQKVNQLNTHITRMREDNAVQRRAEDMAKAGINPLLAAGAPASSGQAIALNAPSSSAMGQYSYDTGNIISKSMNIASEAQNYKTMKAAQGKTEADTLKIIAETATELTEKERNDLENWYTNKRNQLTKQTGILGQSEGGKQALDLVGGANKLAKNATKNNAYDNPNKPKPWGT